MRRESREGSEHEEARRKKQKVETQTYIARGVTKQQDGTRREER